MFKKFLLDILFPIKCLGCKKSNIWLCEDCLDKIKITENSCQSTAILDGLIIATDYKNELVRQIISKFKYSFIRELKVPLGKILIKKLKQTDNQSFDYLIPVPLFKRRELWRGFNQAELLAQEVSKEFSIPVLNNLVFRIKNTSQQVGQKKKKRKENLQNAFKINPLKLRHGASPINPVKNTGHGASNLKNKTILLIDDVFTTGATMQEIAKELKNINVKEVYGLVIAKG